MKNLLSTRRKLNMAGRISVPSKIISNQTQGKVLKQSVAIGPTSKRRPKRPVIIPSTNDVHSPTESPAPTLSVNALRDEQIESVISTCFPLEPAPILVENDHVLSSTLPSFTTAHDAIKTIACFQPSLSLWKVLANVSNDPLGIQHQWRKSHTERYFHQALGVHERLRIKTTPVTSPSETPATSVADDNENKLPLPAASPSFDWKASGLQNPLTDDPSSVVRASVSEGENAVCDVNKALDLDYYILPAATPDRERSLTSLAVVQRNPSPVPSPQAAPIKTVDLFPGSTTVKNDDAKAISDSATNYTSINPKALLFSTQTNAESNVSN